MTPTIGDCFDHFSPENDFHHYERLNSSSSWPQRFPDSQQGLYGDVDVTSSSIAYDDGLVSPFSAVYDVAGPMQYPFDPAYYGQQMSDMAMNGARDFKLDELQRLQAQHHHIHNYHHSHYGLGSEANFGGSLVSPVSFRDSNEDFKSTYDNATVSSTPHRPGTFSDGYSPILQNLPARAHPEQNVSAASASRSSRDSEKTPKRGKVKGVNTSGSTATQLATPSKPDKSSRSRKRAAAAVAEPKPKPESRAPQSKSRKHEPIPDKSKPQQQPQQRLRRLSSKNQQQQQQPQHPTPPSEDPAETDDEKKEQRARNRAAASKCRAKSKAAVNQLEESQQSAADVNKLLTAHHAQLQNEVLMLRMEILRHGDCDCPLIQEYIANTALMIGKGQHKGSVSSSPSSSPPSSPSASSSSAAAKTAQETVGKEPGDGGGESSLVGE